MCEPDSPQQLASAALTRLGAAFAGRELPRLVTTSRQLSDREYDEVMSFEGMRWNEIGFEQVERCADAVFWFSPEAFCYYLPGLLAAGLKEDRRDSNAYDALCGMLDGSPDPACWDDFFRPRWTMLSREELEAVRWWVRWLEALEPDAFPANTYDRIHDTLTLLQADDGNDVA